MEHKKIWTLDKDGNEVLRDLAKANESFTMDRYYSGDFDGNNLSNEIISLLTLSQQDGKPFFKMSNDICTFHTFINM